LTLNQTTGQLTGTTDAVTGDTEITFSITAEGELNTTDTRSFSILILDTTNQLPQWTTPAGSLGTIIEGELN